MNIVIPSRNLVEFTRILGEGENKNRSTYLQ